MCFITIAPHDHLYKNSHWKQWDGHDYRLLAKHVRETENEALPRVYILILQQAFSLPIVLTCFVAITQSFAIGNFDIVCCSGNTVTIHTCSLYSRMQNMWEAHVGMWCKIWEELIISKVGFTNEVGLFQVLEKRQLAILGKTCKMAFCRLFLHVKKITLWDFLKNPLSLLLLHV